MQDILQDLRDEAADVTVRDDNYKEYSFNFYSGSRDYQSMVSNNENFPCIFCDEPTEMALENKAGDMVKEKYSVKMFVCTLGDLENTSEQNTVIQNLMRKAAIAYVKELRQKKHATITNRKIFRAVENVRTSSVANVFDACLTGVLLTFEIEYLMPTAVC